VGAKVFGSAILRPTRSVRVSSERFFLNLCLKYTEQIQFWIGS